MSNINPNCDGNHCVDAGEVRVYPLSGGANLLLCMRCFAHENRYRYNCAHFTGDATTWPQVDWATAKRYPAE